MSLFDGATNMFGPLGDPIKKKILRFLDDPCDATWNDIHGTIVNADIGMGMTIWQAVIAIDPTFPTRGPSCSTRDGRWSPWPRIPDPLTVARAIRYAVKLKPAKTKRAR